MRNIKLIEILKTFSPNEIHDLEIFSKSTYFNKGRNYLPLLRTLKKFHPHYDKPELTTDFIFHKTYPGKKYNNQVMRNQLSGLEKICEQFIVFNQIKENETDYNLILASGLEKRKLLHLSEKCADKCLTSLSQILIDKNYFKKLYQIFQLKREINQSANNPVSANKNISLEAANLFYLFLLEINNQLEEMMVLNYNLNTDITNQLSLKFTEYINFDGIINFLKQNNYDNYEIAELFIAHIKLLIGSRNEENFIKVHKLFYQNLNKFSRWGKYYIFNCLENACIRLESVNGKKYHSILMDLYKEQLNHDAFTQAEKSPFAIDLFRNIVINALSAKELKWTEFFIYKYIDKVLSDNRENMLNYSLSLLNFEKKNYKESLNNLARLKYDSFVFKYDVKVLSLMIYYELRYFEEALSVIDSFKHFINKTKSISGYAKEIHLNFLKYYYEIIKLKSLDNNAEKENEKGKLKEVISKMKIRNKSWLIEKISLL